MLTALSINRVAFTVFGKDIYWYSIILACAVITVFTLCCIRGKKKGFKEDTFIDLCFIVLISGIIGARTLYVLYNWSDYSGDLISVLYIWEGGLAILGGFILAIPACIFYCIKKKINIWKLFDVIAPCFALAQAIGRWGNFTNQELYGPIVNNEALQFFPISVFIDATGHWHLAAFFYESVWSLMTFILLSYLSNKKHKAGDITLLYIVLYSTIRIILDFVKLKGTLANQIICVGMIILVIVLHLIRRKMDKDENFSKLIHSKISPKLLSDYEPEQVTVQNENNTESNNNSDK